MCCRRRYSAVYIIADEPCSHSKSIDDLDELTNQAIAKIIATTPYQQDIQHLYRILCARQRYCEDDLFELFITALAKRRGC